jgi:hypothetical protein
MFAAKEQNFKICNFSTRSLSVTLSQPIMIPNNFHFIESIPLLYREMLISETAVINIYILRRFKICSSVNFGSGPPFEIFIVCATVWCHNFSL